MRNALLVISISFLASCTTYNSPVLSGEYVYITGKTSALGLSEGWFKKCKDVGSEFQCIDMKIKDGTPDDMKRSEIIYKQQKSKEGRETVDGNPCEAQCKEYGRCRYVDKKCIE